ncbi:GNAT family N-acetyltransferase [Streptomyces sp. NPDC006530]|uniref:GNAT family N-acetyltransferase n=1 Tax=Streptomyces sp. NPDC006530 TaxID=3364750 RepID=UPI00368D5727
MTERTQGEDVRTTELASVHEVAAAEWDALAGDASLYSSHTWLRYGEELRDALPRHLVAWSGGRRVAALPVHRFTANVPHFYDPAVLFPGAAEPTTDGHPLLLGGTRLGYTSEALVAPGTPEPLAREALRALLGRLRAARDTEGGLAALLYVTDESVEELLPVLDPGDRLVLMDATAIIPVDANGMDGYRERLSSRRFGAVRKEIRRFEEAGCRAEVRLLSECHEQLGPLSAQVLRRYGHPVTDAGESERFTAQVPLFDDNCRILAAYQGDRMVGFTQFFFWGDVMYGRSHGVDDSMARAASVYFNLTYYQAIRYAAEHGYRHLDMSCDSLDAKVARGGHLKPLWAVVLDAPWSGPALDRVRAEEKERRETFASYDPGIESPVARLVAARA